MSCLLLPFTVKFKLQNKTELLLGFCRSEMVLICHIAFELKFLNCKFCKTCNEELEAGLAVDFYVCQIARCHICRALILLLTVQLRTRTLAQAPVPGQLQTEKY